MALPDVIDAHVEQDVVTLHLGAARAIEEGALRSMLEEIAVVLEAQEPLAAATF